NDCQNANDLVRAAVGCMGGLGGCNRMIPHSNGENNCCTARNDARACSRSAVGTKQVSLRAVFGPTAPRLRDADGIGTWHGGNVPRRRAAPGDPMGTALWRAARYVTAQSLGVPAFPVLWRFRMHPKRPSHCGSMPVACHATVPAWREQPAARRARG